MSSETHQKQMDTYMTSYVSGMTTGFLWILIVLGLYWIIDISKIRQLDT